MNIWRFEPGKPALYNIPMGPGGTTLQSEMLNVYRILNERKHENFPKNQCTSESTVIAKCVLHGWLEYP